MRIGFGGYLRISKGGGNDTGLEEGRQRKKSLKCGSINEIKVMRARRKYIQSSSGDRKAEFSFQEQAC
jgi:hypothetical protein